MAKIFKNKPPHRDLDFVLIKGGTFMMGDDNGEFDGEKPAHNVRLSDYYMCKYLVTQDLYEWVMEKNPSRFKGNRRPVEQVSWDDVQEFIKILAYKTDKKFRLSTEAEWEYAARGGELSEDYTYCGSDRLKQVGWYDENADGETKDVAMLYPNELGLYDMSGNVYEWCADNWHDNYENASIDALEWKDKPKRGTNRVIRGLLQ